MTAEPETLELRLRADLAATAEAAAAAPPDLSAVVSSARRAERRARRRFVAAVALVVPAIVAAAVRLASGEDDTDGTQVPAAVEISGIPVLEGAYRDQGPLADGLSVPNGTVLLGDLFPYIMESGDIGWSAHLLVFGDLDEAAADLERQVSDLGYRREFSNRCDAVPPPVERTVCSVYWTNDELRVDSDLTRGRIRGESVSILELRLSEAPPDGGSETAPPALDPPEAPLPVEWSDLTGPGDQLADRVDTARLPSLRIPEGARSVIPAWGFFDIGYSALLAVDGDVDAVLDDFEQQLEELDIGTASRETFQVEDAEVEVLYVTDDDARTYLLNATTVHGRTWIFVNASDVPHDDPT